MKRIVLAKKIKRILSGLIDMVLLLGASVSLFIFLIYPATFDRTQYLQNNHDMVQKLSDSGLYITSEEGDYSAKSRFDAPAESIDKLYNVELTFKNKTYSNNNLSKDLYNFYTTLYKNYGSTENLSNDGYLSKVLKVGSEESNIESFDFETYKFTLIDGTRTKRTINFFINAYSTAAGYVENSNVVQNYISSNQTIMFKSLVLIIPTIAGISFILNFLIPLFSPHNESIGKYIFGLGILSKDGYKYNKWLLIPRWLIYLVVETIGGIATFGGLFLVTYTMFMFMKKRRCLHDVIANSVVYEKETTIYFDTPEEEQYYKTKVEEKVNE